MDTLPIYNATEEEQKFINDSLIEFNNTKILNKSVFMTVNRCIKDDGEVVGGILAQTYWGVLHVNILWVKKEYRHNGFASALVNDAEDIAKKAGCQISHLDTYDFQAKGLYEKLGYTVFGVLEDCPEGHKHYYMSKKL